MLTQFTGEIIAFATVLCWTVGSQFFEAAGKRAGSAAVNMVRLVLAFVFFCATLLVSRGEVVPMDFPVRAWGWLLLSGLIGFAFGDMCLFRAFVEIGPRLSMLIMSLTAPLTALIGALWVNETYFALQWLGIFVTITGVAAVILERSNDATVLLARTRNRHIKAITPSGIAMAFGGMVGQAVGYILSKIGMQHGSEMLDPIAATSIRVIGGTLSLAVLFFIVGWWPRVWALGRDRVALAHTTAGAFLGPFLGVTLSLAALHYTNAGVASTIMALTPVMIVPFSFFIHREHVSARAFVGTLIAFSGVALLMWS